MHRFLPLLLLWGCASALALDRVYLEPEAFVAGAFGGTAPAPKTLWVSRNMGAELTEILGHPPRQLRQRYWSDGAKSAWILEEIGKEDFITAGFAVKDGHIDEARVLVYRESHGGEVRYPAFLNQFRGAALSGNRLDRRIDGISGATLSVRSMERMARAALYLDRVSRAP